MGTMLQTNADNFAIKIIALEALDDASISKHIHGH